MKKNKIKEHKINPKDKSLDSIMIGAALIIIATLIYSFEIAGKIFYLRYFVTLIATAILFDALNLKYQKNVFHILKTTTYTFLIFLVFILVYVIITLP